MSTSKSEFAALLASSGLHVFPCKFDSKLPAIKDFPHKATTDAAQIKAWWDGKSSNIGISTSHYATDQALIVVDIDIKKGKRGDLSLMQLELEGFELPPTFTVLTPSGGTHLYYRTPKALRQGVDLLGSGIDVRSLGGYVIGPGSSLDDKEYVITNKTQIAPAPEWLIQRLGAARERDTTTTKTLPGIKPDRAAQRAKEWLEKYAPIAIEGEGGDSETFKVSAHLKDLGCSADQALELMAEWNERCFPPWSMDDLETKVRNAFKYGREPRGIAAPEAVFTAIEERMPSATAQASPGAVTKGNRTNRLVSLAGTLHKREMSVEAIEAALLAENAAKCFPPLEDTKVRGIAHDIPARYPNAPKEGGLNLVELGDLLSRPVVPVDWVLQGRLAAGSVSIVASKPKVGKSTLARNLALAIARGEPFLGWAVKRGTVLYLALEERSEDVTADFRALGADGSEDILLADAGMALDVVTTVREKRPVLLVVDPLFRLLSVKDEKAYAEMYGALGPLIDVARQTGTHILCLHHSSKLTKTEAIDAPIGSTALSGAVSTLLVMKRTETYRTLQTVQRIGEDLPETVLHFDAATKRLSLGGSREGCEAANMAEAIVAALDGKAATEALTEAEIGDAVEGKTTLKRKALRDLTHQGRIVRWGTGKRGDPFKYVSCFLVPDPLENSGDKKLPYKTAEAIFEEPEKVVPGFHTYMGNKGTSNENSPKGSASIEEKVVPGKAEFHSLSEKNGNKLFAERENADTKTGSDDIFQ